jgi:hypothetical protein
MPYQLQITPAVGKRWIYAIENPLARIGRTLTKQRLRTLPLRLA